MNIRQQNLIQNTNPILHSNIFLLDLIEYKNEKAKQKKENHCSQTDNKNSFLVLFFRKISRELMERKTSYTLSLIPTKNQKERKRKKLLVISIFFSYHLFSFLSNRICYLPWGFYKKAASVRGVEGSKMFYG